MKASLSIFAFGILLLASLATSFQVQAQSGKPRIERSGDMLKVLGTYETYQWYKAGTKIDGATSSTYKPEDGADAVYSVETQNLSETFAFTPTSIDNSISAPKVVMFPNPTTGAVAISNIPNGDYSVKLMNTQGQVIWKKSISTDNSKLNLDLSSHSKGIYVLSLENSTTGEKWKESIAIEK